MHAALIIDEERLTHEHAMLRRLCVGLLGHGIRLTRIVPETIESALASESEDRIALANRVRVSMAGFPWTRKSRSERLAESLLAQKTGVPDVFYAIGRRAWPLALDLAELLDKPAAINVWSEQLIQFVPLRRSQGVAAYVASSEPIAERLRQRVDPSMVALVPMGAAVHKQPRTIFANYPDVILIAVLGLCEDTAAYDSMLGGLAQVVKSDSQVGIQIAIEMCGKKCHEVWRIARRYELLSCMSPLDDAAQHRDLVTQCDMILLPERRGAMTSLLLEAMGGGSVVIARDDPFVDVVRDEQSGLVVQRDDAAEWTEKIRRLACDPESSRRMGLEGRRLVKELHSSVRQIDRLAETLEWIVGPDPADYRFRQPIAGKQPA